MTVAHEEATPRLTVVVRHRGEDALLEATLDALRAQHGAADLEVLVVGGSVPAGMIRVPSAAPRERTLTLPDAACDSQTLSAVSGDLVTVLAPGDIPQPAWLRTLLTAAGPASVTVGDLASPLGTVPVVAPVEPLRACAARTDGSSFLRLVLDAVATHDLAVGRVSVEVDGVGADATGALTTVLAALAELGDDPAGSPVPGSPVPGSPVAGSAAAEVRHAVQRAVAARLNAGLRRDPDRHGEVLDALRAQRVGDDFPYDVLNGHVARDLAVLYASAPYADTSALVSARRIRARAVVVDVVSHSLEGKRGIDPSADRVAGEYLARRHEVGGPPGEFDWEPIGRFCEEGLRVVEAWVEEVGPYRTVYSRTMWPASHVLAALVAARWPGTRWIAEFSDPQQWNPYGTRREPAAEDDALWQELAAALRARGTAPPEDRNIGHLVELLAYTLADEVVFTNDRQKEFMLGYLQEQDLLPAIEAKAVVSRHPTLPSEFYDLVDSEYRPPAGRVNVGYFGAFYPTRGLREVLGAFERLGDGERDQVRLHIFTPRPKRTRRRLQEFGLRGRVRVRPAVDYLESLRLTRMVDVLLVNDANTRESYPCNPYLPSKWSDYVGSGTDIWAVVEEGSVLSDMDVKYRSVLGDVDGALGQLRRMIAERAGG